MKLRKLASQGFSHIILPIIVVIAVGAVGTFVLVHSHADSLTNGQNNYGCVYKNNNYPEIEEGSTGNCVKFAQSLLNLSNYPAHQLTIDGQFGPQTKSSVEYFQKSCKVAKLAVDGIVGPQTWYVLVQYCYHGL